MKVFWFVVSAIVLGSISSAIDITAIAKATQVYPYVPVREFLAWAVVGAVVTLASLVCVVRLFLSAIR